MTAITRLPWPAIWTAPRRGLAVSAVLLSMFGAFAMFGGIQGLTSSPPTPGAGGVVLASPLMFVLTGAAYFNKLRRRRRSTRAIRLEVDGADMGRVVVPYGRGGTAALILGSGAIACMAVTMIVFMPQSEVVGHREATAPYFGIFALVAVGVLVATTFRPGRQKALILYPEGFTFRGWRDEVVAPWVGVHEITPWIVDRDFTINVRYGYGLGEPRIRTRAWWSRRNPTMDRPETSIRVKWLSLDPVLTLEALRFYRDHPEHRHELGSPAGVARIRAGAFEE